MTTVTSYATGQDMLARYDARLIGDLVQDEGIQVTSDALPLHVNLIAALEDAYGMIVSTLVVGDRYTLDQIDPVKLAPSGLSYLKRLNCDMALLYIKRRRGKFDAKGDAELQKNVDGMLKALKDGAGVLLGILDSEAVSATLELATPQIIPICSRNTIRWNVRNYYPTYPYRGQNGDYGNCNNGNGNCNQ